MRSMKCKECKKYLGKSLRNVPNGTIDDGTNLWCNQKCYDKSKKYPLDKIFVDYHKTILNNKDGQWEIKKVDSKFIDWINGWGDEDEHPESHNENKLTEFGTGYKQAISDICEKLKMKWRRFDKRTKTGFSKDE